MAFAAPALAIGAGVGGAAAAAGVGTGVAVLTGVTTAAGIATSAYSASQQNAAIEQSLAANTQAASVQGRQLAEQAGLEKLQRMREADIIRASLRVIAGEAGTGEGGTYNALMRQADYDERLNLKIINRNYIYQRDALASGAAANQAELLSQARSPILDAFTGGLQGLSTGLSIADAGLRIAGANTTTPSTSTPSTSTPSTS